MNRLVLSVFCLALLAGCARQSAKPDDQMASAQAAEKNKPMPQMSPEEMMQKVKQAATPGPEHERLKPLVGKWQTTTKMWMEPGKEPQVSKGRANHQWMFGKRFLKQDYTGDFNGEKFQGTGTLGYDNVKKAYVSTWLNSMGTGIMTSDGKYDPAAKAIEMNGKYSCPLTGDEMKGRTVTRIISEKEHVFEMYSPGPDGKEVKTMEIIYKKRG